MLQEVKMRCGIPPEITVYDEEIEMYIKDAMEDMRASGVPEWLLDTGKLHPQTQTAVTLYVKAYLGNDRTDTDKYLDLYRKRVFRLTLEDEKDVESEYIPSDQEGNRAE
ncbi:phage head-tail connector protein [Wansuia hejianensis]|uniref:Uncharacterized protein n=2 Tax=Wansuia hejianensis TaxID=2763667 RepID=A0A7G9G8P1_9FIRM|nr:hypothetical protein H9Q79_09375 [Wansuia hejianensis]